MSFFDYDDIYQRQFEQTLQFLKSGLTDDVASDVQTLEAALKTLWDDQAIDWIGRGDIYLTKSQASIAATEQILQELKDQLFE